MQLKTYRSVLLAGVASMAITICAAQSWADEPLPSVQEMYRMLQAQQKRIQEQDKRLETQQVQIDQLQKRAARAEQELSLRKSEELKTKAQLTRTEQELSRTNQAVIANQKAVTTAQAEVDKARAELGTAPSNSVFKTLHENSHFKVMAEFLYLAPIRSQQFASIPTINNRENLFLNPGFDPAFRVGALYNFGNGIDINLAWTHFTGTTKKSDTHYVPYNGGYDETETGRYKLDYDTVDFEAGYNFLAGDHFRFRLHGGLRFLRTVERSDFADTGGPNASRFSTRTEAWGIGPRVGLAVGKDVGAGFSLFGHFAGSIPVGQARTRTESECCPGPLFTTNSNWQTDVFPGFDSALGVAWNYAMTDGGTLGVKLGYRIDYRFGLGGGEGSTDKLGLHGFFFGASWKFGYK
ncbi:MAG: Lpg1974 family pore-forming outer membrane protein [Alphaproteobacteria bacterium]